MFKLIGIVVGYLLLGYIGAIIGFFSGAFFDRMRAYGSGGINPLQNALRQAAFLETVFISMGKLAKADGHISQDEIDHVELFMQKLGMTDEHRKQAITLFKQGADAAFDIAPTYQRFMAICGHTKDLKQILLVYLIVMAHADGHFHPHEEALLTQIAGNLGYDQSAFRHLLEMVVNQSHFGSSGQANSVQAIEDAYKALGINRDSTDAEVKRAYRKLMSQHHPDKLMGQGVPEDMIKVATEQAKDIQLAYDLITKTRRT